MAQLRRAVAYKPGMYKLHQCDQIGKVLKDETVAVVEVVLEGEQHLGL